MLLGTIVPASAIAAAPPVGLEKRQPASVLFGQEAPVSLTATLPAGAPAPGGYNLSLRDVLPRGISYVAAPGEPAPSQYPQPDGTTVLIWQNLADLTPGSSFTLSYRVAHRPATPGDCAAGPLDPAPLGCDVGASFTNTADAYLDSRPRCVPQFDGEGEYSPRTSGGCAGDAAEQGHAADSATTTITALEVDKEEPSPEGELLRGLHDHQTVYTLRVRNNGVRPTTGTVVEDYLPANLEFLGCPADGSPWVDNTTGGAHLSGTEEYAGSGPINPGNAPAAPGCTPPDRVETVVLAAGNPQGRPAGVYTRVVWSNLGDLAAGAERELRYVAAIPLRENEAFAPGQEPAATSGLQAANLDNNTGPRTDERQGEQLVVNWARATGDYQRGGPVPGPVAVSADDELQRTAEDLRIVKSVDRAGIAVGDISTWTLAIATGEYFDATRDVRVEDTLTGEAPNALCPIGEAVGGGGTLDPACAPGGGASGPEYRPSGGGTIDAPFAGGTQQRPDGTWSLVWDRTTVPALADLGRSSSGEISFRTRTLGQYYGGGNVRTGDSWANDVAIAGDVGEDAGGEGDDGAPVRIRDVSSAGQRGPQAQIAKAISAPTGGTAAGCETATGWSAANATFGPGDVVCWRITATFPDGVYGGAPEVTDFLPRDVVYEPVPTGPASPADHAAPGPRNGYWLGADNAVPVAPDGFDATAAADGRLVWTLGDGDDTQPPAGGGSRTFQAVIATRIPRQPAARLPEDLVQNLAKLRTSNSHSTTFPRRGDADFAWASPEVGLTKDITDVRRGGASIGATARVQPGDEIAYRVRVSNSGNRDALDAEVWDLLPATIGGVPVTCANLGTLLSDAAPAPTAPCALVGGRVRLAWSGLDVAAGTDRDLTYVLTVPAGATVDTAFTNDAGVVAFESEDSEGGRTTYVPAENVDPGAPTPNAPPADDDATARTRAAGLVKQRVGTGVTESGNSATQATIGERIDYRVTATIPRGSTVTSGALRDTIDPRMDLVTSGSHAPAATLDGNALPTGGASLFTDAVAHVVGVDLPASYTAPAGADAQIVLTFSTIVRNVRRTGTGVTERGTSLPNRAHLTTTEGGDQTADAPATTVVEPSLAVTKASDAAAGTRLRPGDTVSYTVHVDHASGTNVSTAHDVIAVDTLPIGITPLGTGGVPLTGDGTVPVAARTITWTLGTQAPGAVPGAGRTTLAYRARIDDPATGGAALTNAVAVTQASLDPATNPEARTSVNSPAGPTPRYRAADDETIRLGGATIEKSIAPATRTVGEVADVQLVVRLPADLRLHDVAVDDLLPAGMSFVGAGPGTVTCTVVGGGVCAGGEEVTATPLTSAPGGTPGSTRIGWWLGELQSAGAERVVTIPYRVRVADVTAAAPNATLTNVAAVHFNTQARVLTPPTAVGQLPATWDDSDDDDASLGVREPRLTVDKQVTGQVGDSDALAVQPGDGPLVFIVTATNARTVASGGAAAHDATIVDALPAGLVPVDAAGADVADGGTVPGAGAVPGGGIYDATARTITWKVAGPLLPEASVQRSYRARIPASAQLSDGQTLVNSVDVPSYWGVPEVDRETGVAYREYDDVAPDPVTLTVHTPQLETTKQAVSAGPAEVNQPFTWRVTVRNASTVAPALGVDVEDLLPRDWSYVADSAQVTGTGTLATGAPAIEPAVVDGGVGGRSSLRWGDVADLGPGQTVVVTFAARPSDAAVAHANPHRNEVVAGADDAGGSPRDADGAYEDDGAATATLEAPALTISKTPDGDVVQAGSASQYRITVTNGGSVPARSVVVTDALPSQLTYAPGTATAAPSGFAPTGTWFTETGASAPSLAWTIAELPAGASVTITLPVTVQNGLANATSIPNTATARSTEAPTPVSDPGELVVGSAPNWSTSAKTSTPATGTAVQPNDRIDYVLRAVNSGNEDATNVVLTDEVPTHARYVAGSAAAALPGGGATVVEYRVAGTYQAAEPADPGDVEALRWTTARLDAGAPALQVGFAVTVRRPTPDGTVVRNNAHLTSQQTPGGVTLGPVEHPVGSAPQLTLQKRVDHGDPTVLGTLPTSTDTVRDVPVDGGGIAYTLRVENTGDADAAGVVVDDEVPAGTRLTAVAAPPTGATVGCRQAGAATFDPCPTTAGALATVEALRWTFATLTVDDPQLLRFGVEAILPLAHDSETVSNVARVTAGGLPPVPSNPVTTLLHGSADLAVEKTGPAEAPAGATVAYRLLVTNRGPATATAVQLRDQLPPGTSFVSTGSDAACRAVGADVVCDGGDLAPNAQRAFDVQVRLELGVAGTTVVNRVTAVSPDEPDPPSDDATTVVGRAANLSVEKLGPATAESDGDIAWTLVVRNAGPNPATDATVVDTLPEGVELSSVNPSDGCTVAGPTLTCRLGTLAVGGAVQRTVVGRVSTGLVGRTIENVARVTAVEPDPDPRDDQSTVTTTIGQGPTSPVDLRTTKELVSGPLAVGAVARYRLTVINRGPTRATGVRLVDTPSLGVDVRGVRPSQGRCDTQGGTVRCDLGDLDAGAVATVLVDLVPTQLGTLRNAASSTADQPLAAGSVLGARAEKRAPVTTPATQLRVTKTAGRRSARFGQRVRFAIRVRNVGRSAAVNVRVCDRPPRGLTFVRAPGARYQRGRACWTVPVLPRGASRTFHVTARVDRVSGTRRIRNVATASARNARQARGDRVITVRGPRSSRSGGVTG